MKADRFIKVGVEDAVEQNPIETPLQVIPGSVLIVTVIL